MVVLTISSIAVVRILGLGPGSGEDRVPASFVDLVLTEVAPVQEAPPTLAERDRARAAEVDQVRSNLLEGAGTVTVHRAEDGAVVMVLPEKESGFLRGMMRSLGRQRGVANVAKDAPYRISQWPDGSLTFDDPSTGESIAVRAFGPDNLQQLADLMKRAIEMPAAGAPPQEATD